MRMSISTSRECEGSVYYMIRDSLALLVSFCALCSRDPPTGGRPNRAGKCINIRIISHSKKVLKHLSARVHISTRYVL